jgi:hypothetical protein
MSKRACPHDGRVDCQRHKRRPSKHAGAWGWDHRRRAKREMATSPEVCWRCGGGPRPDDPWEAGHVVPVSLGGGPEVRREHRSCNRRHGGELRWIRR